MTIFILKGIGKMSEFDETIKTIQNYANQVRPPSYNIGINSAGADVLAKDIMEYSRSAYSSLSTISQLFENSAEFYDSRAGDKLRKKFKRLSENFPILIQNMENYALSIKKAERLYNDHADIVVIGLNKSIDQVEKK